MLRATTSEKGNPATTIPQTPKMTITRTESKINLRTLASHVELFDHPSPQ